MNGQQMRPHELWVAIESMKLFSLGAEIEMEKKKKRVHTIVPYLKCAICEINVQKITNPYPVNFSE